MNGTSEAIDLFWRTYSRTPQEAGYPVIDVYEKQNAFLYAASKDVIKAYKIQQNILRWIICRLMPLMGITLVVWCVVTFMFLDNMHPLCLLSDFLFALTLIILIVMAIKVWQTDRVVKLGKNVTFLNYEL